MRFWVKILLFLSAYTPLFLIFILRYVEFNSAWFWGGIVLLILVNLSWVVVFRIAHGWTKNTFTVKKSINKTSDTMNYVMAYVFAFLELQFSKWQDAASLVLLLVIVLFIYVSSNLIVVNPLLNLFGYRIYDIEVVEGGDIMVITRKNKVKLNEKINVKHLSDDIYLEVS